MLRRLKVLYLKLRSEGFVRTQKWLIITLYHRFIPQKQVIWSNDLTEYESEEFNLPDNVQIRPAYSLEQIDEDEYKKLAECRTDLMGSAGSTLLRERFDKGAVLWLLIDNLKFIGYQWTIVNNHVTPTYFPHTEKDVHFIGIEIFPDFRGRQKFQLLYEGVKNKLKKEGYKRYHGETYLWNKPAIKAFLKTSARPIGVATRFNIFSKNVIIWHDMTEE